MTDLKYKTDIYGTRVWRNDAGQLHRLDGPAVEYMDGYRSWWIDGRFHRLDGPAIEDPSIDDEWFVDDKPLSEDEFERHPLVIFYRLCKEVL
jgi:hypothetical protein